MPATYPGECALFPNPPRPRRRRKPSNSCRYVREVKGGAWQARVWLGVGGGVSLNLGLFTIARWETREHAEWAAARASREFVKRWQGAATVAQVVAELQRRGLVPAGVVVPDRLAALTPAAAAGATEYAAERRARQARERDRRLYGGGLFAGLVA